MKKSKIYTKKGDLGETSLVDGSRVKKSFYQVGLYGEIDYLNCTIGLLINHLKKSSHEELAEEVIFLQGLQSILFDLGAFVACPREKRSVFALKFESTVVSILEKHIDVMDSKLPELKNFILPGGHEVSCSAHICRTVCRRVERLMVEFLDGKNDEGEALKFLNRLSDYFFVLSRYGNIVFGYQEIQWKKNKSLE